MLGYSSTLDKSMNGVKTLTDGISIISDGIATHENIIYNDFIKSEDGLTEITNDKIITEEVDCNLISCGTINSSNENTNILNCNYLYVNDVSNPLADVMEVNGQTKKLIMYSPSDFRDTVNIINKNLVQTQAGFISQTGTNFNTLKDTKINGFLEVGSNLTQTGGSSVLKDTTIDNITMNTNKGITQSGSGTSNTFGTSTITNLTITGSVTFPSSVTIPGTTTSDDIVMNNDSVITQDTTVTTTKFNKFRYTKTLDLDVDGNFTQIKAGATATLKNTIIQGTSTLQGDIEQTAGFTKLNTIECNNITLRENNSINFSGTGRINQTGTGENIMNAINLNNNQNITFNGTGIISQPLNGTNILSHFRSAGFGIIGGRNNTTYTHYQNIQNNNGLQMQYNRDNSTFQSYFINNRVGSGGGFRFQRYNGGVYVDEPLTIGDVITSNTDLFIVGNRSFSVANATLGVITQNELNCLDNCNTNIITKFNNLDSQIASLQTTTGGVSTATTGISYNTNNDTTTIDNNLVVSGGKSLTLGTTNVNSFITDTNTFITASTNTLQGIVYTSIDDTTTINNNVSVTGNLLVQGMNIKAEIDALETSFTTGTLNTTTLTAGTLNVTNQINMTNPSVNNRNINGVGYLNIADVNTVSSDTALRIAQFSANAELRNYKASSHFVFSGLSSTGVFNDGNQLRLVTNSPSISFYNPTTQVDDILLFGKNNSVNMNRCLNLTVWSNTGSGVRITPTNTTMTGGSNNISIDSSTGINFNGISKYNSGVNNTEIVQSGVNFNIENNVSNGNIKLINDNQESINVSKLTTTINNNIVLSNTINNNQSFFTRQNNLTNINFTSKTGSLLSNSTNNSGSGSSTQTIFTFTISPYYNKQININVPIGVSRTFKNSSTVGLTGNNFTDTINNVSYVIYKNNEIWQGGNCTSTEELPRQVVLSCTAKTSDMTYEFYMTNAKVSFLPTHEEVSANYKIDFTVNYSYTINSTNFVGISYVYFFNTSVNPVSLTNINVITDPLTNQPVIGPYGTTYANGNYTLTKDTINNFTGVGELWTNDIISNSLRNSGNINTYSFNCNKFLKCPGGIAGYIVSGTSSFELIPIICSLKQITPNDSDNYIILMPNYKITLYPVTQYGGNPNYFQNLDQDEPIVLTAGNRSTSSLKVYYLDTEISLPPLS